MLKRIINGIINRAGVLEKNCSPECERRETEVVTLISNPPDVLRPLITYYLSREPVDPAAPKLPEGGCPTGNRFCQHSLEQVRSAILKAVVDHESR